VVYYLRNQPGRIGYEEIHRGTGFTGLTVGLAQLIAEARAKGIEVEQIDSPVQRPGTRAPRRGELVDVKTFPQVKAKPVDKGSKLV